MRDERRRDLNLKPETRGQRQGQEAVIVGSWQEAVGKNQKPETRNQEAAAGAGGRISRQ